jgi:hypothetical protein
MQIGLEGRERSSQLWLESDEIIGAANCLFCDVC